MVGINFAKPTFYEKEEKYLLLYYYLPLNLKIVTSLIIHVTVSTSTYLGPFLVQFFGGNQNSGYAAEILEYKSDLCPMKWNMKLFHYLPIT